jgi:ubiquinone/menaquinone biosynthesis C-methylase UbiE
MADSGEQNLDPRMREEWNASAREDAGYAAFGRGKQDDAEFFAAATGVINDLETELRRVKPEERGNWRALEIGCGPGRLMRPMSRHFVEIHGVDVSGEMIGSAREKLQDVSHAYPHVTDGGSLSQFEDESFDFVYSYAFFPHIPSREVVLQYLREMQRVLRVGGLARLQFNGLPETQTEADTGAGARFTSQDLLEFAHLHDFQVLALDGVSTQYMWTTWRKQASAWSASLEAKMEAGEYPSAVLIRRITNASSTEPVAPCRGRFAAISIRVENLPPDAGLNHLRVTVGSSLGTVISIGPPDRALWQQIKVDLPELEATGLLPVQIFWRDRPLSESATLRVIPPGPSVPRILWISDAVNPMSRKRIEHRLVKMKLEEIARPHEMEVTVGGYPAGDLEYVCTEPRPQRFQVSFRLPEQIGPGVHPLELRVGHRKLAPVPIEVVAAQTS